MTRDVETRTEASSVPKGYIEYINRRQRARGVSGHADEPPVWVKGHGIWEGLFVVRDAPDDPVAR